MAKKPENAGPSVSAQEALDFHAMGRPGKLEIVPTKPMATQRDSRLAYSPGVAVPVLAIAEDPSSAYDYTTARQPGRRHLQRHRHPRPRQSRRAGLEAGDGRQGGPVQALRRRRLDRPRGRHRGRRQPSSTACAISAPPSAASTSRTSRRPDCFIIEQRLRELMDIPVFHDDQHGTAIIAAAGLINALDITGRDMKTREARLQRRGRGRHRLHRTAQVDGLHAREHHPLRHQGRGLSRAAPKA